MLQRLSRLFLIVLLLAAIPAQGLAAVSMGICRAAHDGQASGHGHAAADAHGHDRHDAHSGASPNADGSPDAKSAHCGACTACGAAAGISPSVTFGVAKLPADRIRPDRDLSRAGITPAGLDRPPLPHSV